MATIYVSIGNSDNKLTQYEWNQFSTQVVEHVRNKATRVHGEWYSPSNAPYQNACICFETENFYDLAWLRSELTAIRHEYRQDSIAWAEASTEFI
ncbi:hypothetical protein [Nonomuraea dietziae]|uniref:hypothetical protein n=1 Tax=Nonomuraea dietziae TaxID=65515 RepID=UPI0033CF6FD0